MALGNAMVAKLISSHRKESYERVADTVRPTLEAAGITPVEVSLTGNPGNESGPGYAGFRQPRAKHPDDHRAWFHRVAHGLSGRCAAAGDPKANKKGSRCVVAAEPGRVITELFCIQSLSL